MSPLDKEVQGLAQELPLKKKSKKHTRVGAGIAFNAAYVCIFMYMNIHTHTCTCIYLSTHTHTCICMYCVVCVCVCVCVCTRIHARTAV
jgi:hypothetical protein